MFVNDDKRILYEKIIDKWLSKTNVDIFIINSSGEKINKTHSRLFVHSFRQKSNYNHNIGPSIYERDSMLEAISYFDFSRYDYVFKITGKYFVKDFENMIKNLPNDADIIFQNQIITYGQNTEIIGIRPSLIKDIVKNINQQMPFEKVAKSLYCSNKCYRLPPLIPEIKVRTVKMFNRQSYT
jgi:hypothetical protein